jgi:hypothetical protein
MSSGDDIVNLNVGGRHFATIKSTLAKDPKSSLGTLVATAPVRGPGAIDSEGRIFIDRDPQLFEEVLAYLRDGPRWIPPSDLRTAQQLANEFKHFNLSCPQLQGLSPSSTPNPLVLLSGEGGSGLYFYNSTYHTWSLLDNLPVSCNEFGERDFMVTGQDKRMFLTSGQTGNRKAMVYSVRTKETTSIAQMPSARGQHTSVCVQGNVWLVGGTTPALDTVHCYSPGADKWTQGVPLPEARSRCAAVVCSAHPNWLLLESRDACIFGAAC